VVKLPVLSGEELIKLLKKAGFQVLRQKGSHVSLQKENHNAVVPLHDELSPGTLMGVLSQCGLKKEDLQKLKKIGELDTRNLFPSSVLRPASCDLFGYCLLVAFLKDGPCARSPLTQSPPL
jgi:predicted RNA binding protein YcfA (HicA-like mRNA interferase family)